MAVKGRNPGLPIPSYAGWRGEVLAHLYLSQMEDWEVTAEPLQGKFDYSVLLPDGFTFMIEVKAFSSLRSGSRKFQPDRALRFPLETRLIVRAKEMRCPVALFVFDADSENGRYARIDQLAVEKSAGATQSIELPPDRKINKAGLSTLVKELRG